MSIEILLLTLKGMSIILKLNNIAITLSREAILKIVSITIPVFNLLTHNIYLLL